MLKKKREKEKNYKQSKKQLKKQADWLWFRAYLQPQCEVCGKKSVQLHHFYYKLSYPYIRHLRENGISLCRGCHFIIHHKDPKEITEKIKQKRGKKWINNLDKIKDKRPFGFGSIDYYEQIIKGLNGGKNKPHPL